MIPQIPGAVAMIVGTRFAVDMASTAATACRDCGTTTDRRYAYFCDRCRPRHRGKRTKYQASPEIDQIIQFAYERFWGANDRQALNRAARRIEWPGWKVKRRGQELGLARTSENTPWKPEEERILRSNGQHSADYVVRALKIQGFCRSRTAVHLKMRRERIKQTLDGYSSRQLAEAFGVDSHKIMRWISAGLLKADRREQNRVPIQGGCFWWITHTSVRNFVFRCPHEIDLRKVEKWWFLDIITEGRICR
jgi:DNA-directed RNA polymerase specialized sigma24 family protein